MRRKILTVVIFCCLGVLMTACGNDNTDGLESQGANEQGEFLWNISILDTVLTDNLTNTQTFIQYDGVSEKVPYSKASDNDNIFLLLNLSIDKNDAGGAPFSWKDVYVLDSGGNKYYRHENDTFLEDYNFSRIKATDLTIGDNTGYVCFEIPSSADTSALKLVHVSLEGENIVSIPAM